MTAVHRIIFAIAGLLVVAVSGPAAAHPHVFVDARAEIVFNKDGAITAVRHIWQFDKAFTAFAIQGLDANNDGKLSDDELKPLAKVNVDSLKEYDFFTWLRQGKNTYPFVPPTEYWLEFHGGRLTLFYTLPLKKPVVIHGKATLEVFDPEYFVAFSFPEHKPVTLTDAPAGCTAKYHPPQMLDAKTMAALSAIPADQHDLPPDLQDAAAGLANLILLNCPGEPSGSAVDPFEAVMAGGGGTPPAAATPPAPAPQAAPPTAAVGTLTADDIAAAPGGSTAAPAAQPPATAAPAAEPAAPTELVIHENDGGAGAPSAAAARAEPASGESMATEIIAIVLAVLLAAGIAVAGFFLQRSLRRSR